MSKTNKHKPVKKQKKSSRKKTKKKFEHYPIFQSNKSLYVSEWIPSISKDYTQIDTDSWFDFQSFDNPQQKSVTNYKLNVPVIPPESFNQQLKSFKRKKPEFLYTQKIRLYPNDDQIIILNTWFDAFAKMYNVTIQYLRPLIKITKKMNYVKLNSILSGTRKHFFDFKHDLQDTMVKRIPVHELDEAIGQAVSHFKTCLTNYKNRYIRKFRIREWSTTRARKIIKIEGASFKKGTFCHTTFPSMKSSEDLSKIGKTCTLQYNSVTKKYILLVPTSMPIKKKSKPKNRCGIDLGIRTFATIYSENKVTNACNDKYKFQKNYRKIDIINAIANDRMNDNGYRPGLKRGLKKYHTKIINQVKDMHYKLAHKLVNTYDEIYLGKLNTKRILSKRNTTISTTNKRILKSMSPYLFRIRLTHMGYKYGSEVTLVDEYKTTITCSNCGKEQKLGASKEYKCSCGLEADRDENAAKNIMKVGLEKKKPKKANNL